MTNRAVLSPLGRRVTRICLSTVSLRSSTWEMIPTSRSSWDRDCKAAMASRSVSSSREPKPSSTKSVSSRTAPAGSSVSDMPSARHSDAWKDSPPERLMTLRRTPV